MAVTYQNKAETKVLYSQTSCTVSAPTGFSAGDLLIAQVMFTGNTTYTTTPAGWTEIQKQAYSNYVGLITAYRIAEAGDTNWTWIGLSMEWFISILRYTGQHASSAIHASDKGYGVTDAPTAPSVAYTGLESGSLAIHAMAADGGHTPYTTPAALDERLNDDTSDTGGCCGDKAVSGTSSTGTAVFGISTSDEWVSTTVVIAAAGAPTGAIMNQFQKSSLGADLFNGALQ